MLRTRSWTVFVDGEPFTINVTSNSNHLEGHEQAVRAEKLYREAHDILGHGLECPDCRACPARKMDAMDKLNRRMMP